MATPKRVHVSPFTLTLEHDPAKLEQHDADARLDETNGRIYMNRTHEPVYLKDSVLHEAIHAMYHQTPLFENNAEAAMREEAIVAALTPRILAFIRDNPRFVAWLQEAG